MSASASGPLAATGVSNSVSAAAGGGGGGGGSGGAVVGGSVNGDARRGGDDDDGDVGPIVFRKRGKPRATPRTATELLAADGDGDDGDDDGDDGDDDGGGDDDDDDHCQRSVRVAGRRRRCGV